MKSTKHRFKNDKDILDAIDECHTKSVAWSQEADTLENEAQVLIRQAWEIEQETIAHASFRAGFHVRDEVLRECERWHIDPEQQLPDYLHALGVNHHTAPIHKLEPSVLEWVCANWSRVLLMHISRMRFDAQHKLKTAQRRRTGAHTQINDKAVKLGELLSVMRTTPMDFLFETNKGHDASIPAI